MNTLPWVLVFFTTMLGSDGRERISVSDVPQFHATRPACLERGNRLLSKIDVAEGVSVNFVCLPAAAFDLPVRRSP